MMKQLFFWIAISIAFVAQADANKDEYELSTKCGRQAKDKFKEDFGNASIGQSFKNHYSKSRNKCFYLAKSVWLNKGLIYVDEYLVDLNDNDEIGTFTSAGSKPLRCNVRGKVCQSREEWEALATPYMQD